MKTVALNKTNLDACVSDAQKQRVVVTRDGNPVALVIGIAGLDREQIRLGTNAEFLQLIQERRKERTIPRADLERSTERKASRRKQRS
jgi:antitoxin (DNA-binding transcriptional repressor) of toxin-antitoxin stability system